jgi:hypothetical protein
MRGNEYKLWKNRIGTFFLMLLFLPFGLIGASLLILPFFLPLFLIKGFHVFSLYLFIGLLILLVLFLFLFTRRKSTTGRKRKRRALIEGVGLVLLTGIIIHIVFGVSSNLVLKQAVDRAKAAGIKLKMEEVIPPMIPDEMNAAIIYNRIFELYDKLNGQNKELWQNVYQDFQNYPDFSFPNILPEQLEQAGKLLLENPEFIKFFEITEEATAMTECRFPLKYEDGPATLLPHLSQLRSLAQILAVRTYFLVREGNYASAWQSFATGLAISNALESEPTAISQLTRYSLDNITMTPLREFANEMIKGVLTEDYQNLISVITRKEEGMGNIYASEVSIMGGFAYGDVFQNRYKRRENFIPFLWDVSAGSGPNIFWRVFPSTLFMPLFKRDAAFYLEMQTEMQEIFSLPFYQRHDKLGALAKKSNNQKKYPIANMLGPGSFICHGHQRQSEYLANLNGLKFFCALQIRKEHSGQFPERLEQLVPGILSELPLDPFTGNNYIYRQGDGGFIVYSSGANQRDDSGIKDLPAGKDDISWRYTKRKTFGSFCQQ